MSDSIYRLLKGSVLTSPYRNVANPTGAQGPARDDGERIAFGRSANLEQVALEVGTTDLDLAPSSAWRSGGKSGIQ